MANLAIKGHATRGNEVIEILEMLGGRNPTKLQGNASSCGYYIDSDGNIAYRYSLNEFIQFTIEEFLEKFPYKVGDKVWLHYKNVTIRLIETITRVHWCSKSNCILYDLSIYGNLRESDLTPYKEETREEGIIDTIKESADRYRIKVNYQFDIEVDEGEYYAVRRKPQYPKTYKECCNVLGVNPSFDIRMLEDEESALYFKFIDLVRCRNAYWKIAGEQMGLGKPWHQDYNDRCFIIANNKGNVHTYEYHGKDNVILSFPTEEMHDAFYENFKELIENCKELL